MTETTIDPKAIQLFNEEGSITVYDGLLRLRLATPNRAQIGAFAITVGGGTISVQAQANTTLYVWSLNGKRAVALLKQILPQLTGRREEQAIEVLAEAHERGWV
jgi:hypothetical protein